MLQTGLVLLLLGLWVYIVLLEPAKHSPMSYSVGFWDAGFGGACMDPSTGNVPSHLNAEAAR